MTEAKISGSYKDRGATERRKAKRKLEPSEKQKVENELERQRKETNRRIQLFTRVFGSKQGKEALEIIMLLSGHQQKDTVANPNTGELSKRNTLYNSARRDFYLDIREYIPARILAEVECFGLGNFPEIK